jgi:hypothetical protein
MEPLSVAATESAIINTAVRKTELSAVARLVFFFQKVHALRYAHGTCIGACDGRCACTTLAAAIIIRYFLAIHRRILLLSFPDIQSAIEPFIFARDGTMKYAPALWHR